MFLHFLGDKFYPVRHVFLPISVVHPRQYIGDNAEMSGEPAYVNPRARSLLTEFEAGRGSGLQKRRKTSYAGYGVFGIPLFTKNKVVHEEQFNDVGSQSASRQENQNCPYCVNERR